MGSMCAASNRISDTAAHHEGMTRTTDCGPQPPSSTPGGVYHERQRRMLCAVHALNNLLQCRQFEKGNLDRICETLNPRHFWNPHRNPFGWGNYDVNVLMAALQQAGFDVIWFDKRKNLHSLHLANIFGFIINIPVPYSFLSLRVPFYDGKHWIALRRLEPTTGPPTFFNLDSKLAAPVPVASNEAEFRAYLESRFAEHTEMQLLLVVTKEVAESEAWRFEKDSAANCVS